jgi:hypothetical protein
MNDASLITLLAAVVGLMGGAVGAAVGATVTHRNQHQLWLSEKKIDAVSAFVENNSLLIDRFRHVSTVSPTERVEWLHAIQSGRTTINLLCAQETRDAARELARLAQRIESEPTGEAVNRAVNALKVFVDLAREEIHETKRR